MEKDKKKMAERILNLTIEIIYLLTGEDYIVVKKMTDEDEAYSGDQVPIMVSPSQSLIHKRNRYQEILEVTNKITELLTEEVPIRCEDVTVYFSMEEWEYLEGHKDQYDDVIMLHNQTSTTSGRSSKEAMPEQYLSPLFSKNYPKKNQNIPQDHQDTNVNSIKAEDIGKEYKTYVCVTQQCKEEEISTDISAEESYKEETLETFPSPLYYQNYPKENQHAPQDHQAANLNDIKVEVLTTEEEEEEEDDDEEMYVGVTQLCEEEEVLRYISTGDHTQNVENLRLPQDYEVKYNNSTEDSHGIPSTIHFPATVPTAFYTDPKENGSGQSQNVEQITGEKKAKIFSCSECGKHFKKKSILSDHEKTHRDERPFSCSECGKSFKSKSSVIQHQITHKAERPFQCPECGKNFKNKSSLSMHERIHREEKPFSCSECGKSFRQKPGLFKHQSRHRKEKTFSCSECDRSFRQKSDLVIHQKRHRKDNPFLCSECGKCYCLKSELIVHQKRHRKEEPFSCPECDRGFLQKASLIVHLRTHTGEKPHSCSECGKCFTQRSTLVRHMTTHTGEKPFSCSECGRCYSHKSALAQHKKRRHFQTVGNDLPQIMDKDRKQMAEKILNLTLKIIYLLTGEDYTVVKKISDKDEAYSRDHMKLFSPHSRTHEKNCYQEILELTSEITELLTGEVSVRCQDITIYFSMEEWEYLKGHKDQYKDIVMENHQSPASPDESSEKETLEKIPSPPCFKDCPEENQNVPSDDEVINLHDLKVEVVTDKAEPYADLTQVSEEELSTDTSIEGFSKRSPLERSPSPWLSQDYSEDNQDVLLSYQVQQLSNIKDEVLTDEEETYGIVAKCKEEEISTDMNTDDYTNFVGHMVLSEDYQVNYNNMIEDDRGEHSSTLLNTHIPSVLHSRDQFTDATNPKEPSSGQSQSADQSTEAGRKVFPCAECGKKFSKKSNLSMHERIHRDERPFSCSECGKSFRQKSVLFKHQRRHRGEEPFSCSECNRGFQQKSDLIVHQRTHTGEKPFSCSECGKCFMQKSVLVTHQKIHSGVKPFSCLECGKCFTRKQDLFKHQITHTGMKPFSCSECGKCFTTKSNLVEHQKTHTGVKPFSCPECGKCFIQKSDVVKHQKCHTGEKPYSCSECGKCFARKSCLIEHQRTHTGEKPFSCPECGKCFSHKSAAVKHQVIHTGEKPFSCLECGKCFTKKSQFIEHSATHTGEELFSCSECGKSFSQKSNLVIHQRTHSEKPFLCSECGKCFTRKSSLMEHLRSHTGEKPFLCPDCGKCFSQKSDLVKHHRTHTGEKPFSCSECGKFFRQKSVLVNHQLIHTGEKPFSCSECDKCYSHRAALAQHKKRSHFKVQTVSDVLPSASHIMLE
ncbi:oocyte zinc finger protein XlCOF7.1-like [Dendropsophus ebraccatus]|uniref:oocyte zinc finger protein XlCOF7.1-like n=1 Tax=Dendropsophus ebraccatus TaxID=150705 RepID=UPI00383175C3